MVFNRPPNARAMRLLSCSAAVPRNMRYSQPALFALRRSPAIHLSSHRLQIHTRFASTSREVGIKARLFVTRSKNFFLGASIGLLLAFGYYYITDTRASVHQWLVVPSLRWIYDDAEEAHEAGTRALKELYALGLHPRERGDLDSAGILEVEVFGHRLANPIGISAGLDKGAEIPSPLFSLGPAVVEVGGVTPRPQAGNAKPRVFRLPSQEALINRYGLNSEGADIVALRLRLRVREHAYDTGYGTDEFAQQRVLDGEAGVPPGSLIKGKLLAVQLAKNTITPDDDIEAVKADFVYGVEALGKYADILVVNISCPNTGSMQMVEPLGNILTSVVEAAKKVNRKTKPVVMVKVSPDEDSETQLLSICDAVRESNVDGVIVSNTTKKRPDFFSAGHGLSNKETAVMAEQGGFSGPQSFQKTVALVKRYRRTLDDGMRSELDPVSAPKPIHGGSSNQGVRQKVIFASGGITNERQVQEVLAAGSSVALLYTGLVYGGVGTVSSIKAGLKEMKSSGEDSSIEETN